MKWIRCNICQDLKQEVDYYKNGDNRRKTCKKCMQEKYFLDKKKKKEYDKKRYKIIKEKKVDNRHICMRCGKYYVNVRNNELEWCFSCLLKYEKEWKQKIKVELISSTIRKKKDSFS